MSIQVAVTHTFSDEDIEDIIVTMIECNDISAGWVHDVRCEHPTLPRESYQWYEVVNKGGTLWITADDPETTGTKDYPLTKETLLKAFVTMQQKGYTHIVDNLKDDYDAIDAEVLLQFVCFGEEVYC